MSVRFAFTLLMVAMAVGCSLSSTAPTTIDPQTSDIKTETFTVPLDNAIAATIDINAPFEKVFVSAATDSANLLDAEVEYMGEMTFTHENGEVTLRESGTINLTSPDKPLRWNVLLHPSPALILNLATRSGELTLDASSLNLAALDLNASSGTIDADVPATNEALKVGADVASGQITVNLADNALVDFTRVAVSSGAFILNVGAEANVTLADMSVSSGNIKVDLPPDAAVRLEVQDVASGMVNIAYPVVRITGTASDEGIWETQGFAMAENQVSIVVTSVSSGTFELE